MRRPARSSAASGMGPARLLTHAGMFATGAALALAAAPAAAQQGGDDAVRQELLELRARLQRLEHALSARASGPVRHSAAAPSASKASPAAPAPGQQAGAAAASPAVGGPPARPPPDAATVQAAELPSGTLVALPSPTYPTSENSGQQNAFEIGGKNGRFRLGGVTITLGGFVETVGIFRTRNEVADTISNLNTGIPLPQSQQYHENEFRQSARPSRVSFLIQGQPSADSTLTGYVEADFLGAGGTANSVETSSYQPRLRQALGAYENQRLGLHVLAGQTWSLLTQNTKGTFPPNELVPPTIDSAFVAGFTYTRQPQVRVAQEFGGGVWLAASAENPETTYYVGPNGTVSSKTVNYENAGGGGAFQAATNYSNNVAPDIVVKAAWDPGFGHYEAYGLARFLSSRVSTVGSGANKTVVAGGGGGAFTLPLGSKATFQASVLAGYGIGRYGPAQLPNATIAANGAPAPLPGVIALAGVVAHPTSSVDAYALFGLEHVGKRAFSSGGQGYGYGSPLYVNTGCRTELSTLPCTANTSNVLEATVGGWWRLLKGDYGTVQAGAQYAYVYRSVFAGIGGHTPTDNNEVLVALRYLPFQ